MLLAAAFKKNMKRQLLGHIPNDLASQGALNDVSRLHAPKYQLRPLSRSMTCFITRRGHDPAFNIQRIVKGIAEHLEGSMDDFRVAI